MTWRAWGGGPPLVLLHGGHGSWTHWLRNIEALARTHRVIVPDMPGYGDSADLAEPHTIAGIAAALSCGLDEILPGQRLQMAGFSFGSTVGSLVAGLQAHRLDRLVLVGAGAALGGVPTPRPLLRKWRGLPEPADRDAAHRHNLIAFMLADAGHVGDDTVAIQARNAERTRLRSRQITARGAAAAALAEINVPLGAIWGRGDVNWPGVLEERMDILRARDPDCRFAVIEHAAHWVQYEAAEEFNETLAHMLAPTWSQPDGRQHAAAPLS
ncbi:alpha/beta fold hydrolase [Devosia sp. Root635]|uniref:alpha/beta fold hydrolase n=1 Tax=Devosia sp. Root635 TaxID=1736575 RepID=UPI00138F003C|nr:alpha/beta hydrolase [Devosia sp. Root635]